MGKTARAKVSKKATKIVAESVSKDEPVKLSKGQRFRKEKREKAAWKKGILESVTRNKSIDRVGQAFGTMEDLAAAILTTETPTATKTSKKGKGCLKQSALYAQRVRDLDALDQICAFKPFVADPINTIQSHLRTVAQK
jgi:hypothetical protein